MKLRRPTIKTSLLATFIVIAAILAGFGAFSIDRLQTINGSVSNLAQVWMPSLKAAKDISERLSDMRIAYLDHVLSTTENLRAEAEQKIASSEKALLDSVAVYEGMDKAAADAALTKEIRGKITQFQDSGKRIVRYSNNEMSERARDVMQTDINPLVVTIVADIDKLVKINEARAQQGYQDSQGIYDISLLTVVGICLASMVLIGCAIWFALFGIANPIQKITRAMRELAEGDSDVTVPFRNRADEIGLMAAAVEVFRSNAIANLRLESQARDARSQTEAERQRQAEIEHQRSAQMAHATSALANGLKHLANGDLSFALDEPFAGEFESLRADFNAAVRQLAETLNEVTQASVRIDAGTRGISDSANDLSRRTEQQAATLEETAAALDEITANVISATKRTEEARSVAHQATRSANESGKVVANAVGAMQKIEQSSSQVNNIIGVIDEIAFQTNLLALNAGVEAARAGEAGKGFAVVAQEVRELAQRSAKAAKEIKDLIRTSTAEVNSGVTLVSETGRSLQTIADYIVAMNDHMEAIAASAKEQSDGLSEVNASVNKMDHVTQQNAAMVEESNAASATLASEAERLRDLIAHFNVGQRAAAAPRAVASHAKPVREAAPVRARVPQVHGNAAVAGDWEEF